ncbi:MAG: MraY family glycosyltransferase [Planctomycetota bacterium]
MPDSINSLYLVFGSLFILSFVCSVIIVPLIRKIALRLDFVDHPGEHKTHAEPVSYGGGAAIYLSFILVSAAALAAVFGPKMGFLTSVFADLSTYLEGLQREGTIIKKAALFFGATLMFLLGIFDDKYSINPYVKLAGQIIAASVLFFGGIKVTLFVGSTTLKYFITVLWVVGITNAFNLLDNMDGLSAGVAVIAGAIFFVIAAQSGQLLLAAFLCIFVGSVLGFLPFNFFPARIYMGDAGSLFLGFILSATAISGTYYTEGRTVIAAIMPVVVLCIPIFDTLSVMIIRLKNGKPLMVGDRNHFSHRLNRLGMTKREAVLTIYILSATLGVSAIILSSADTFAAIMVLLHTVSVLTVIAMLELAASRRNGND